jgi:polysaccharide export outer membrane protein
VNWFRLRFCNWLLLSSLVSWISLLSGCATTEHTVQPIGLAQTATKDYVIGAGDNVNVAVWRNPEVSMTVTVRPDGKITTPLVEDMPASGKTPNQLARDIEAALTKFIQQPIVTVIVTGSLGPYSEQVRVIGQAAKPQALPYREGMSLLDVLIVVGGITEFASGNKANVIRQIEGKQVKLPARLNDLVKDGDISANMPMRPGDILVIPEGWF